MVIKLGLLISGNLGYLTLIDLVEKYQVEMVMTDKGSTGIIEFAQTNDIPIFIGNPRKGKATNFISNKTIDVIASVNYLFIVEDDVIQLPSKLAFNIHGSLLPKYRGRTPHVWAIINNEKETGVTAHIIRQGCDTGEIIKQIIIPIRPNDTGAELLKKYNDTYPGLILDVLKLIEIGNMPLLFQDDAKATYFGKRTPEDGQIDWNWQKERINNWVRAQAHPYPGAFAIHPLGKLVIDEIAFDEVGYDSEMKNGLVISIDPIKVKTPNGVVMLTKIREEIKGIQPNDILI
jgi:methionyl-tRNA formyltransferase